MKNKINIIFFTLLLSALIGFAGCSGADVKRTEVYLYSSGKYEKLMIRTFINDSVFYDRLYEDYKKLVSTDTFKIINSVWYYKDGNSFCEFFSESSFKKREIKRIHYDCSLVPDDGYNMNLETYKPLRIDTVDSEKVYVYEKVYTAPSDTIKDNCYCCHVYFNPLIGFVYIEDENCRAFKITKINAVPEKWEVNLNKMNGTDN